MKQHAYFGLQLLGFKLMKYSTREIAQIICQLLLLSCPKMQVLGDPSNTFDKIIYPFLA